MSVTVSNKVAILKLGPRASSDIARLAGFRPSILLLYQANGWSAAGKPAKLAKTLRSSHSFSAWDGTRLVGLGNAISGGHLVVYYSHLLVHPDYQWRGIGKRLLDMLMATYKDFRQQILVADGRALEFYRKLGLQRPGKTKPLWIYAGKDH